MVPRLSRGLSLSLLATAAASALAAACGPATPSPTPPATSSADPTSPASPAAAATLTPTTASSTAALSAPSRQPVPADTSSPPGVSPLTEPEAKEFSTACRKLSDAVVAAAKKERGKKPTIDIIESVFAHPPNLPGVDVPRCAGLMRRDMVAYLANKREAEAKLSLKRIMVGLMTALEREPPAFCASAPPVPPSLDTIKDKPYESTMAEWKAEGWACARFDLAGAPQVFQYELRTDPKTKTFEVIARGYAAQGAAPTELFIAGKAERGAIDPSAPVMRR